MSVKQIHCFVMTDIGFQWHSRVVRGYDQKSYVGTIGKSCVGTERKLREATNESRASLKAVEVNTDC